MFVFGSALVQLVVDAFYLYQLWCRVVWPDVIFFRCGSVLVQLVVASLSRVQLWLSLLWHVCPWFRIWFSCGSACCGVHFSGSVVVQHGFSCGSYIMHIGVV